MNLHIKLYTTTADYLSGSGTTTLLFRHVVQAADNDSDGISLATTIDLNGGTLLFDGTQNCSTTITSPNLAAVQVDNIAPIVSAVTAPTNGTYYNGLQMIFKVTFSENVSITGTPRIALTLTSGTVYADYVSGSGEDEIYFRKDVGGTDQDLDGLLFLLPLNLMGVAFQTMQEMRRP